MSARKPTKRELDMIAATHQKWEGESSTCRECQEEWPCPTWRLVAYITNLTDRSEG